MKKSDIETVDASQQPEVSRGSADLRDSIELLAMHELTPEQRAKLLRELADRPELWRILALEFVNNQVLQEELSGVGEIERYVAGDVGEIETDFAGNRPNRSVGIQRMPSGLLLLAASLMFCFLAGTWWAKQPEAGERLAELNPTSRQDTSGTSEEVEITILEEDIQQALQAGTNDPQPASAQKSGFRSDNIGPRSVQHASLGSVAWVDRLGRRELPVFTESEIARSWSRENPVRVNQALQRKMAQGGWRVTADWRFMAGKLSSGQEFVIPVAQPEYEYVGFKVY